MRYVISFIGIATTVLFSSGAFADEIDEAYVICRAHNADRKSGPMSTWYSGYQPGWEHCKDIEVAKMNRESADLAKRLSDKEKADRQKTLDVLKAK